MHHFKRRLRRTRVPRGMPLIIFAAALLLGLILLYTRLSDLVQEMGVAIAKNTVTRTISTVVAKRMSSGDLDYNELITLRTDGEGNVTALTTNMSSINTLKAELSEELVEVLTGTGRAKVLVPLGNLLGSHLLTGLGPDIPIRITLVEAAKVDFASHFSHAGINQTLHEVMLNVQVDLVVLTPGGKQTAAVKTQIAVAETVIVGKVPESYTYFEGDDQWDENLEQFDILN